MSAQTLDLLQGRFRLFVDCESIDSDDGWVGGRQWPEWQVERPVEW